MGEQVRGPSRAAIQGHLPRSPLEVAEACVAAHDAGDWDALRALLHPEAQIATFAGDGKPGDPERAIADMSAAAVDPVYRAAVSHTVELDDHAVVLQGRVRYRSGGGFADVERCWLHVVVDGLLFRSRVFRSAPDAVTTYESLGLTLGAT